MAISTVERATKPLISVLIATRNRPHSLLDTIASILRNTVSRVEIVVVDQSDTAETATCLRATFAEDARVRYHRDYGRGTASGRNVGLTHSQADIIAITDDDCLVPTTWLADILNQFAHHPDVDLLYGCVDAPEHDYSTFVVPVVLLKKGRIERRLGWRSARLEGIGANMALRRRLIGAIGDFNPWFGAGSPRWSAEDFELHYRALCLHRPVLLDPTITVLHLGMRPIGDAWALWERDAQGDGALAAYMVARGTPLAALRFWWWNIGRIGLRALFNLITFQWPAGLRLTVWMMSHSARGFSAEWRTPGPQSESTSRAFWRAEDVDDSVQEATSRGSRSYSEPAAL